MNTSPNASGQWRWKPVDIIVMIVAFVLFWPLGLVFIAWKIWNDRQPNLTDLAVVFQQIGDRIVRLAEAASEELRRLFGQVCTNANRPAGGQWQVGVPLDDRVRRVTGDPDDEAGVVLLAG